MLKPKNLYLTETQFNQFAAQNNGICSQCHTWAPNQASPDVTDARCPSCKSATLHGVSAAKEMGFLITIQTPNTSAEAPSPKVVWDHVSVNTTADPTDNKKKKKTN